MQYRFIAVSYYLDRNTAVELAQPKEYQMWKPIRGLARVVKAKRNARYGVSVFAAVALVTGLVVAGSSTALADDKPTTDAAPSVSLGAFSWDCNAKGWAIGNTVVTNNEDVPLSIGATSPIDDITAQTVAANSGANFGFVTDLSDVAAGQVTVTASWTDRTGPDFTGTVDYSAKHCDPMVAPTVAFTTHADGLKVTVDKTVTGTNPTASWQWGDGTDSPGSATSHTYAKAGTYSITLTAFNDAGSDSVTHDVTVKVKDTEPTCVDASKRVLSHTWDKTIGRGTVTLTDSLPLCTPLYIVGAAYQYDTPATTGQWSQTLSSYSDAVVVTEPGTYNFATPQICGQRDVYAMLGEAPKPSQTLTGPGKPYEPPFLSDFSQGPATYGHDNPKDCVPTPVTKVDVAQPTRDCDAISGSGSNSGETDVYVVVTISENDSSDTAFMKEYTLKSGENFSFKFDKAAGFDSAKEYVVSIATGPDKDNLTGFPVDALHLKPVDGCTTPPPTHTTPPTTPTTPTVPPTTPPTSDVPTQPQFGYTYDCGVGKQAGHIAGASVFTNKDDQQQYVQVRLDDKVVAGGWVKAGATRTFAWSAANGSYQLSYAYGFDKAHLKVVDTSYVVEGSCTVPKPPAKPTKSATPATTYPEIPPRTGGTGVSMFRQSATWALMGGLSGAALLFLFAGFCVRSIQARTRRH